MATLVAIGYPDQATAEQARETVGRLESDLIVQADQVAAINRDAEGGRPAPARSGEGSGGCCLAFCSSFPSPDGRWAQA
jgi:hypothetical protein